MGYCLFKLARLWPKISSVNISFISYISRQGRIFVGPKLEVPGKEDVYALGDCAEDRWLLKVKSGRILYLKSSIPQFKKLSNLLSQNMATCARQPLIKVETSGHAGPGGKSARQISCKISQQVRYLRCMYNVWITLWVRLKNTRCITSLCRDQQKDL